MEEWLYFTDLPGLCSIEEKQKAIEKMKEAGWQTEDDGNRLMLRKTVFDPPAGWYTETFGPEADCCLSILRRHTNNGLVAEWIPLILIRAGEEGYQAYENACKRIHRDWAEKLREKELLPHISQKWFGA
jgi:hypothetical protein